MSIDYVAAFMKWEQEARVFFDKTSQGGEIDHAFLETTKKSPIRLASFFKKATQNKEWSQHHPSIMVEMKERIDEFALRGRLGKEEYTSTRAGIPERRLEPVANSRYQQEVEGLFRKVLYLQRDDFIRELKEQFDKDDFYGFFEELYDFVCVDVVDLSEAENYFRFKEYLIEAFPFLLPYYIKTNDGEFTKHLFSERAVESVVKMLKEKHPALNELPCHFFTLESAASLMPPVLRTMAALAEPVRCAISIHNQEPYAAHPTALYIEKRENRLDILVLDSVGNRKEVMDPLLKLLEQVIAESQITARIYVTSRWRQSDTLTCSIFCIRDIVSVAGMNVFGWIEQNGNLQESEKGVLLCHYLPPEMMKMIQSKTLLEIYNEGVNPLADLAVRRKKTNERMSLYDYVAIYRIDHGMNGKAMRTFFRYEKKLLLKLLHKI